MNIRRLTIGAVAAFAAATLLAGSVGGAADLPPVTIPVILPMTGAAGFIGQTHEKTLQILEESLVNKDGGIKGRQLKFDFLDDQTSPAVAKQLGSQVQAQSTIVLGSSLSAMCQALAPVFEQGPIDWCLSPAIFPAKGSYVFTTSCSTKDLLIATMRFFRDKGLKRIAILATQDASGQDGVNDAVEALKLPENSAMSLVATERYTGSDVTATAQVTRIKAAGAQALIIWAPGTPFATALRAVQDIGLQVPIVSTSANMVAKQLEQYGAFMPKEMYFAGVTYAAGIAANPRVKHAQDIYFAAMKANGVTPDLQTGLPWDTGMLVVDALRKVGPAATAAQIRDYLENLKGYPGMLGIYDFTKVPQRGAGLDDVVMMQWTGSGWSTSSSFGGALK